MQVAIKSLWTVEMTGQELSLISKALTGSLKPGEAKQAKELAKAMAEMRVQESRTLCEVSEGALAHCNASIESVPKANS